MTKPQYWSHLDLTYYYSLVNFPVQPPIDTLMGINKDICSLLKNGWTDNHIKNSMDNNKCTPVLHLMDNMKLNKPETNLLDPYRFYYHNQLRIVPGIPPVTFNEDDTITQGEEEYYLEMRASYTMKDLYSYYTSTFNIKEESLVERCRGIFTWMLKAHNIDLLLYMIDAYASHIEEEDKEVPVTPFAISDFVNIGRMIRNSKKTEAKNNDDNRILPRKRIVVYRDRG